MRKPHLLSFLRSPFGRTIGALIPAWMDEFRINPWICKGLLVGSGSVRCTASLRYLFVRDVKERPVIHAAREDWVSEGIGIQGAGVEGCERTYA
jgi:hypothetical protein